MDVLLYNIMMTCRLNLPSLSTLLHSIFLTFSAGNLGPLWRIMLDDTENGPNLSFNCVRSTCIDCDIPRPMKCFVRDIKNQVVIVITSRWMIGWFLRHFIWILPANKPYVNIINVTTKKREMKAEYLELRDVAEWLKPYSTTEILVLIQSCWLHGCLKFILGWVGSGKK